MTPKGRLIVPTAVAVALSFAANQVVESLAAEFIKKGWVNATRS